MEPRREDVPQQNDFNQEEVLDEQLLLNQERNFIVVQMGADCSQIKEEQEDVCISQERQQFVLKQETQTIDEDAPQLHDCKEEEVLTVQQLCNQERNSSLDQEEQDAAQVKEEEELIINQEEKHFELKQETDTFMILIPIIMTAWLLDFLRSTTSLAFSNITKCDVLQWKI
ncbi:uncharacterized protein KZ484_010948 [Pholidichthys leucotaenia]